jgi:hypothetical protein
MSFPDRKQFLADHLSVIIIINTLFKLLKIPSAMLLVLTGEQ